MRAVASAVAVLLLSLTHAQTPATKIKSGDQLGVLVQDVPNYSGEYTVSTDGTISGRGFGRILVAQKSLPEVEKTITSLMARYVKSPRVTLTLIRQRPELVYITGAKSVAIDFIEGLDVRQLLATAQLPPETDRTEVNLFRNGNKLGTAILRDVLLGKDALGSTRLKANDMVSVLPIESIRVWATGLVNRPGEQMLPVGTTIYQLVAAAGGVSGALVDDQELTILLRRGPEERTFPIIPNGENPTLEPGDTITVQAPRQARVTVAGEVRNPGTFAVRSKSSVVAAIARAGGLTPLGSYLDVTVIRGEQSIPLALGEPTVTGKENPFPLQDGDVVMVRPNERFVLALGEVNSKRSVYLRESKVYRVADIIADAGGVSSRGSTVRVYLGRKMPNGNLQVIKLRFDKFLKDGDLSQNPEVKSGDVVMVDTAKPTSVELITQALTNSIYVATLRKF